MVQWYKSGTLNIKAGTGYTSFFNKYQFFKIKCIKKTNNINIV